MPHWKRSFPVDLAEEGHFSRREFVRFLALVSAGFTMGIGYLALRKSPLDEASDPAAAPVGPRRICPSGEVAPGNSRLFTYRNDQDRCILVRTRQGALKAYRQTCTHLGCSVRWDGARLECPCHHGYFEVERGFPVQGPPTRPLPALAAVEQDGFIWIVGALPKPTLSQEARS